MRVFSMREWLLRGTGVTLAAESLSCGLQMLAVIAGMRSVARCALQVPVPRAAVRDAVSDEHVAVEAELADGERVQRNVPILRIRVALVTVATRERPVGDLVDQRGRIRGVRIMAPNTRRVLERLPLVRLDEFVRLRRVAAETQPGRGGCQIGRLGGVPGQGVVDMASRAVAWMHNPLREFAGERLMTCETALPAAGSLREQRNYPQGEWNQAKTQQDGLPGASNAQEVLYRLVIAGPRRRRRVYPRAKPSCSYLPSR